MALLTKRYFQSHGPALVKDYMKWSGFTASDAKAGIALIRSELESETIDGKTFWFFRSAPTKNNRVSGTLLLPNYDEYFSGYIDYSAIFDRDFSKKFDSFFPHSVVIDGQVVGAWKREFKKNSMIITLQPFRTLNKTAYESVKKEARHYSIFLDFSVKVA